MTCRVANSSSIVLPDVRKSLSNILYGIVTLASPETRSAVIPSPSCCQPSDLKLKPVSSAAISLLTHSARFSSALLLPSDFRQSASASVSACASMSDGVTVMETLLLTPPEDISKVKSPASSMRQE